MHFRSPGKLSSGYHINLDVYQTELRFAMAFSKPETVSRDRHSDAVNRNPPRMTSGGNGDPFFGGHAESNQLGRPLEASQPLTLGLSGFGGALVDTNHW
jgi:hypothetical protein